MTKMKKLASLLLAVVMAMGLMTPVWAMPNNNSPFTVFSPTFPDAYILIEEENIVMPKASNFSEVENSIIATVFVSERWEIINGQKVIVESRLLSKKEVDEIGIENFAKESSGGLKDKETFYKLTLQISGTCQVSGQTSTVNVSGRAIWDGESLTTGIDGPSMGLDYMGFAWGGDFNVKNSRVKATSMQGKDITMTQDIIGANDGVIWHFYEFINGNPRNDYAKYIDIDLSLKKDSMTGNGNLTAIVCQYIHTYTTASGSISFSAGGPSFTLTGVSKQWSISVAYGNARY